MVFWNEIINLNQKKDDPDFPYLLSDFDKITSKC